MHINVFKKKKSAYRKHFLETSFIPVVWENCVEGFILGSTFNWKFKTTKSTKNRNRGYQSWKEINFTYFYFMIKLGRIGTSSNCTKLSRIRVHVKRCYSPFFGRILIFSYWNWRDWKGRWWYCRCCQWWLMSVAKSLNKYPYPDWTNDCIYPLTHVSFKNTPIGLLNAPHTRVDMLHLQYSIVAASPGRVPHRPKAPRILMAVTSRLLSVRLLRL